MELARRRPDVLDESHSIGTVVSTDSAGLTMMETAIEMAAIWTMMIGNIGEAASSKKSRKNIIERSLY